MSSHDYLTQMSAHILCKVQQFESATPNQPNNTTILQPLKRYSHLQSMFVGFRRNL